MVHHRSKLLCSVADSKGLSLLSQRNRQPPVAVGNESAFDIITHMKTKLFSLVFLASLLLGTFPIQKTQAFFCVPTTPMIGIVSSISTDEFYAEITMEKSYIFDKSDWDVNKPISIDRYEDIVKEYVRNNFQLSEKAPPDYKGVNIISVPIGAFNQAQIKNGDVIINGPPYYVCTYRFTALFSKEGNLRSAIVDDSYQDYSYRNSKLKVKKGKELECDKNSRCKFEVNFKLDGISFNLSPGQSYKRTAGWIKSISLLDSSDVKNRSNDTVTNWDFGTSVLYVLDFSDSTIQAAQPPEDLNFSQKIIRWFEFLFD